MTYDICELLSAYEPPENTSGPGVDMARLRESVARAVAADSTGARRGRKLRRTLLIAAACAAALSLTALAAAALGGFDWLRETVKPGFIDVVEPVERSVTVEGIEAEAIAAQQYGDRAICYVSLRDTAGQGRVNAGTSIRVTRTSGGLCGDSGVFDEGSGRLLYEFQATPAYGEIYENGDVTLYLADILYNEREIDFRCGGLDLASAARGAFGRLADVPGSDGAYIAGLSLEGDVLSVQVAQDMSAPVEYKFRPYLLGPEGETIESDSSVSAVTPLDRFLRPRGWDEGGTIAIMQYSIYGVEPDMLDEYTLCLGGMSWQAVRGDWVLHIDFGSTPEPIEAVADVSSGGVVFEDSQITLTPLYLHMEGYSAGYRFDKNDIMALPAYLETDGGRVELEPDSAPVIPMDYEDPDGNYFVTWNAAAAVGLDAVRAIVIGDTRIETA